jgi:hypothetical protein
MWWFPDLNRIEFLDPEPVILRDDDPTEPREAAGKVQ